ncbi:FUSC family protein [Actinoplanes sp. L3-i22]|uniref:FUSC family protein n=1 Tax=Actinoplanes sp. L3-i22 TaxID=2836373 RepID=UPI001C799357|nr:FUSC family protein [Actinoplanes sp. L3-i22]BCY09980.1 fusaric acid resistance protein [Actinoplanes sp. L3-i22]
MLAWLRRRDPGLSTVRRAARITVVACAGFYLSRYVLGNPGMAPYALFTVIALGLLSQISGSPGQRARTLLGVLPVGWVLVTLGTLLSFNTWAAAAGMFVLGFLVSFAGVGGPRLVGLAAGGQLLYILPCFPPYDPGGLGWRLAGVTLAVLLLAGAELVLWPDATPVPYRTRLATAIAGLSACLTAIADSWSEVPGGRERLAALLPEATEAADALRPSRLPPTQRPASAGKRDRALSSAAGTVRLLLGRVGDLNAEDEHLAVAVPAAAELVRVAAGCAGTAAAWLRGEGPVPDTTTMSAALQTFRLRRMGTDPEGLPPERLRLGSLALSLGEWVLSMVTAIRIAAGAPIHPDSTPAEARPGPFWYAYESTRRLWWHRLRENLTPRSVHFQGALRLAAALAAARLLSGILDVSHGFWVLLTVLTVLRTSAAATRSTLRPALVGTVIGSVAAAGLLFIPVDPMWYALLLPVLMLVGFAAGPLLGLGWSQGFLSVTIALIFAQVSPVDWRLAETRVLDVAFGAVIGVVIGLFAWPRGASGELHRAAGIFLADGARVVRDTVDVLAHGRQPGAALPRARSDGMLAEASYALFQSEPAHPGGVDWQATLVAGHHAVRGAEALIKSCPTGGLLPCVAELTVSTADVAGRYEHAALALLLHDPATAAAANGGPPELAWPDDLGRDLYHLADLRVWLDGLRDDLGRLAG